jgi:methylisocitrate lyase
VHAGSLHRKVDARALSTLPSLTATVQPVSSTPSPGARFRAALAAEKPLQIAGTINAYTALLAKRAGFQALYLSGAGVANASHGLPDLGMTHLEDVLVDARRITARVDLPLLVDIDTGWGHAFNIARAIRELGRAGVAAVHIEDQVAAKRCGHRPGKELVASSEMCDRLKAAVDARLDADFVIMARTDAVANEGVAGAIARALEYVKAGADMIFAEALTSLDDYRKFTAAVKVPVLANITEFGQTPLFTVEDLRGAGVSMALYPLSAFRAMNAAARDVYTTLRRDGTQRAVIDQMQTRAELYDVLGYQAYEQKLDQLFKNK